MVLMVLYWVLLILVFCVGFAPDPYKAYGRNVELILFIILGLKLFGLPS